MKFFPFYRLFVVSGFVHVKYDPRNRRFKLSKCFLLYAILLTISIQLGNTLKFIDQFEGIKTTNYAGSRHELIGKVVVTLDHVFWLIISSTHPIVVLLKRRQICEILSHLIDYNETNFENFGDRKIKITIVSCLFLVTVGVPIGFIACGYTNVWRILSGYGLLFHLIIGQLYEFVFFQKIRDNHSILQKSLNVPNGNNKVWNLLSVETKLVKLSKLSTRVFALSKIVLLFSVIVLMAVQWFYNYDEKTRVAGSIVWQSFISVIFFGCHIWDRLLKEVSFVLCLFYMAFF